MRRLQKYADVVPCVTLPARGRQHYTYHVPAGLPVPVGSIVRVPFGERAVLGVTLKAARRPRYHTKDVLRVESPPLVREEDLALLTALAELSLEPLSLLVKALVAVRWPLRKSDTLHAGIPRSSGLVRRTGGPHTRSKKRRAATRIRLVWSERAADLLRHTAGKQTLVLVPELVIAEELARCCRNTGIPAQLFSQGLPLEKRRAVLEALVSGADGVTIATHSGIFLPFAHLADIIVAETALPSHRQWDAHPRYDARLASLLLGRMRDVPVTLQSSLPSLDMTNMAQRGPARRSIGEGGRARQRPRALVAVRGSPPSPRAGIVRRTFEDAQPLSVESEHRVRETLARGKSVFLFQNVLGSERLFVCSGCGHTLRCKSCGGILQRGNNGNLLCPTCGTPAGPVRSFCPRCHRPLVRPRRTGTRALERLLGTGFPGATVVRLDRESLPRRAGASFRIAAPSVLIGTERAFAFLPAAACGVSVILDGDALLSSLLPDAAEAVLRVIARIAQLTEQPHERTVLVQTTMPTFPLFSALDRGHVAAWVTKELADRERLDFPPYATLALCSRVFPSRSRARRETLHVVSAAKRSPRVRVGWRQSERGKEHRSDILLRGPRAELSRLITAQARAWDVDFHVPVSAALSA